MNWIVDAFIQKVSDIISGVKKPKKTGEKALVNMAGPHKSELCEACMLGKCTQKDNALGESSKSKYDTDISKMLRELAAMKF